MNCLRILSGEKQGASLTLGLESTRISANFDAVLMLSKKEIAQSILEVNQHPDGLVTVNAVNGNVVWQSGSGVSTNDVWHLGDAIKIGEVWLMIADPTSPWPTDLPMNPTELAEESALLDGAEASEEGEGFDVHDAATEFEEIENHTTSIKRGSSAVSRGMKVFSIVAITMGIATFAHSFKAMNDHPVEYDEAPTEEEINHQMNSDIAYVKKMLVKREIPNVKLNVVENAIELDGTVSALQSATLDRMIERIVRYRPSLSVKNKTSLMGSSVPFKIVSVITGSKPQIYLEKQGIVSVGQQVMGYRLESVTDSKITFSGAESLVINW